MWTLSSVSKRDVDNEQYLYRIQSVHSACMLVVMHVLKNTCQHTRDVVMTLYFRRCDIVMSHRRKYNVISTSCAHLNCPCRYTIKRTCTGKVLGIVCFVSHVSLRGICFMLKNLCKVCQMFHLLLVEIFQYFYRKKMPACLNVSESAIWYWELN